MLPPSQYQEVQRICELCDKSFKQFIIGSTQRTCPTCLDLRQRRPSIILSRKVTNQYPCVVVDSLPGPWSFIPAFLGGRDTPSYKIDYKGSLLGSEGEEWCGRIVVRAISPYHKNSLVSVRCMTAIHADRINGKISKREYLVLSDPKKRSAHLPSLVYLTIDPTLENVTDHSLWSKSVYSGGYIDNGKKLYRDRAILAIVDKNNVIVVDASDYGRSVIPE